MCKGLQLLKAFSIDQLILIYKASVRQALIYSFEEVGLVNNFR